MMGGPKKLQNSFYAEFHGSQKEMLRLSVGIWYGATIGKPQTNNVVNVVGS